MDGTDLLLTVSVQLLGSELLDLIHERLGSHRGAITVQSLDIFHLK